MSDINEHGRPTGTVTFLFTDIEGSAKLAQKFPQSLHSILEQHNTILKQAIEAHNGYVFHIIGDAFCASFFNANDALNAAYEIQRKLISHDWKDAQIKVRMGIHTGEAEFLNDDYIGYITLSRVQRIMSVGNGGQVLVTQEVQNEISNALPEGVSLRDLGERKLKDIILPEHIYQIVAPDLPSEFPQLKSLDARPNNLPLQITKFIGREKEITAMKKLFTGTRKLTIVGPGGTGKTRLAIRVANDLIDEFENGVWFIELSSLTDPELIVNEMSLVLNLKEERDVDPLTVLKEYLKPKEILLILDNCEHLLDKTASILVTLLQYCPKLKVLSTSREPFNINGEAIYRVPPLSVPDTSKKLTIESLEEYESAKLFIDRAQSIKPDFKVTNENVNALGDLCKKLDGIPFAIELAATRVNVLPVEKILDRLTDRFKLLTRGSSTSLPRHQTLRALIDWSYELLNPNEKTLLQRLSIFMGGWTLEASEEICSDDSIDQYEVLDLLTGLENKSLVTVYETGDNIRYNMLETIKQYSSEKFTERAGTQKKHFEYYLNLSDWEKMKNKGIEQMELVRMLESENDNLRMTIQWAMENDPDNAFRIIPRIGNYWLIKAYFREGYQTCLKALEIKTVTDKKLRADVLLTIAEMSFGLGYFTEIENFINEALELFKEIDDKKGIALCLIQLGNVNYTNLEIQKSKTSYEEALKISEEIDSKELRAKALRNLSFCIMEGEGDKDLNLKYKEDALKIFREIKDTHNVASALAGLGIYEFQRNNFERANIFSEESLAIARETGDQYFISINLINLGRMYSEKKDFLKAQYFLDESLKIIKEYGYTINLHPALIYLAGIFKNKGDYENSIKTYKEFLAGSSKSGGSFFFKSAFEGLGECYLKTEDYARAARYFSFTEAIIQKSEVKLTELQTDYLQNNKNEIKEKLGEDKFNQIWNEGKSLSIEDAVSQSLTDSGD